MQKVVATLEKNVEWIALGLAGIWVLWVAWAFVITKPVAVDVDGEKLSAAKADEVIAEKVADPLRNKIKDPPSVQPIPVPQIALSWEVVAPPAMPAPPIESLAVKAIKPEEQLPPDPRNPNAPRSIAAGDKVAQLPVIPEPRIVDVISDKGQVIPPVIQPNMNQFDANGVAVAQPLLPPQPMQLQPGDAGANPQFANAKDEWWVWVTAKFNEGAVQQAYQAAKIPHHLNRMEYLAVEVQREELLPNGQWGNPQLVPPLAMNAPPPEFDRQRNPIEYLTWALQQGNQMVILEPAFYQTVTPRKMPVHLQPKVQVIADNAMLQQLDMKSLAAQFESGTMLPTDQKLMLNKLSPEQKAELARERQAIQQEKQRQDAAQRRSQQESLRSTRESQRNSRSSGGGRGSYAPIDPDLMGEMLASGGGPTGTGRDFYRGRYDRGSANVGIPMVNPAAPLDPAQMNVVRPGGVLNANNQVVFGEFDVWAYDDTVEPGKSYRYRMRVVLKNPVFRINGAVADPKLAQVMELPAEKDKGWSQWSRPVVVERGVEMFLAGTGRDNVRFDIYRWQEGRVNKQQYTAGPGDVIGAVDSKSQIDFTTGYAVVDIRPVGQRDHRVTLLDPNGQQVVRYLQEDLNNPKRGTLEAEASKPANPALTDLR